MASRTALLVGLCVLAALHTASGQGVKLAVPGKKLPARKAPVVLRPRCAPQLAVASVSMIRRGFTYCAVYLCNPVISANILPFISKHASTILCPTNAAFVSLAKVNRLTPVAIRALLNQMVIGQVVTKPMLIAAKKGQGFLPVNNLQVQKYLGQPAAGLFLGPEGAQTQGELAQVILPEIFISKELVVLGVNNVIVPKTIKRAIRRV